MHFRKNCISSRKCNTTNRRERNDLLLHVKVTVKIKQRFEAKMSNVKKKK